jgi:hypothetical protein
MGLMAGVGSGLLAPGLVLLAGWVLSAQIVFADTVPSELIEKDEVWSGRVVITRDVAIVSGTVRVEPGSTITFAGSPGRHGPVIRFTLLPEDPGGGCPRMVLAGTSSRPITVESAEGSPPGAIVSSPASCAALAGRHVVFRRLAHGAAREGGGQSVVLRLSGPRSDLFLSACRFEDCGPVRGEFFGDQASARIENCTFTASVGPTAIELTGLGRGAKVLSDIHADSAIRIECPQVLLRENVLSGPAAAITVRRSAGDAVRIDGNYVHCATSRDDGGYALKCDAPDAAVTGNVLIGGTYVIETAPRVLIGNVLVGASGLTADFKATGLSPGRQTPLTTTTHFLVGSVPAAAVITGNLFLGSAYSALVVPENAAGARIEHNLFDGWGIAGRAVHLAAPVPGAAQREEALAATLTQNTVVRYRQSPVIDVGAAALIPLPANPPPKQQASHADTLRVVGGNVFSAVSQPIYAADLGIGGLAEGDRLVTPADLPLRSSATQPAMDAEMRLQARRVAVAAVRGLWFEAYPSFPDRRQPADAGATR